MVKMTELESITRSLLSGELLPIDRNKCIRELHDLFAKHAGIAAGNITGNDIMLPTGKAISPVKAAHCLLGTVRTITFIKGVCNALLHLQTVFPGRQLHVLYAGCGPYATLLTPLTTLFSPNELALHLLDISEESLTAVKKLYDALGIGAYIHETIHADAATYRLPENEVMHLVVSETMQYALVKEPQVAIMQNLIPQMAPGAVFVPQQITVSGKLLNWEEEEKQMFTAGYKARRIDLGELYTISQDNCMPAAECTVRIPDDIENFKRLYLFTDVDVFGDQKLREKDTELNLPRELTWVGDRQGQEMTLRYEIGENPGLRYAWAGEPAHAQ